MKKLRVCTGIVLLGLMRLTAVPHGDAAAKLTAAPHEDAAAKLTAVTISPLPYGINVHLAQDTVLAKVKAAGIAWIRIDVNWNVIEASKGNPIYTDVDRVVDYAAANGLSVLASIGGTPQWANGKKTNWWTYPATKAADWKNFVARTVARYKNRVKYWSIWNEPNIDAFFDESLGKDKFVQQILLPAAQTIRGADPAAFIVGPDLSHKTEAGTEWYFWLKYILDNAGNYFDVISHHIYEDLGVYYLYELLEQGDQLIPAVKTTIQESGQGDKPFWITEVGWNTSKYAEAVQASRYLDMLYFRARKNYPQKVFFYEIIDDPKSSTGPFGILRSNLQAKPAYTIYKNYIAGLLTDPGDPDEDKVNKKCYAEETLDSGAAADRNPALQSLNRARDFLRAYSASASKTMDIYYEWNQEFLKISLVDSRVFSLGRKILEHALLLLADGSWIAMEQPLPEILSCNAKALVQIIQSDHADSPLAPVARLVEKGLALVDTISPREMLEFYMNEDILKFKKTR
jgi:hypothetical protein